jgi:hypothetical protein
MEFSNLNNSPKKEQFIFPDIMKESGEIKRVAQKYAPQNVEGFGRAFFEKAKQGKLTDLTEDVWSVLENTDSFDIPKDGWEKVAEHIDYTNAETGANRNWQDVKQKMEEGKEMDAPIILKYGNEVHLVSGNTRLMVARASGKTPKVLIVEMEA